jgi:hypothetical protein
MDKFSIQMNISVLKENILLKNYFHLKKNENYVEFFNIKINFYIFTETQNEKKICTCKIIHSVPKK